MGRRHNAGRIDGGQLVSMFEDCLKLLGVARHLLGR